LKQKHKEQPRTYLQPCLTELTSYTNPYGCSQAQNLICATSGQYSGYCSCATNNYFDTSSSRCVSKKLNLASCTNVTECRSDLGLVCDNTCTCPTGYFWSSTASICRLLKLYTQPCNVTELCDSSLNLVCQLGTCQCRAGYFFYETSCSKTIYTI